MVSVRRVLHVGTGQTLRQSPAGNLLREEEIRRHLLPRQMLQVYQVVRPTGLQLTRLKVARTPQRQVRPATASLRRRVPTIAQLFQNMGQERMRPPRQLRLPLKDERNRRPCSTPAPTLPRRALRVEGRRC